jgi:hypothetical protein
MVTTMVTMKVTMTVTTVVAIWRGAAVWQNQWLELPILADRVRRRESRKGERQQQQQTEPKPIGGSDAHSCSWRTVHSNQLKSTISSALAHVGS